jgi:ATPase family associated with various cellular activities (AAA)
MSIVFDRQFRLDGINMNVHMGFDDVIFVMEDVDAASDVVKRRDGRNDPGEFAPQESFELPVPKSMFRMLLESPAPECQSLIGELTGRSERLKEAAELHWPDVLRTVTQRFTAMPGLGLVSAVEKDATITKICNQAIKSSNDLASQCSELDKILVNYSKQLVQMIDKEEELDDVVVDELLGAVTSLSGATLSASCLSSISTVEVADPFDFSTTRPDHHEMMMGLGTRGKAKDGGKDKDAYASFWKPDPDQLSLAGLLNVLDGVVDSPGRIIIMTTNHPEKLDPALVRPGRIDKKILLGHMLARDIVEMLGHFFQKRLSPEHCSRVENAICEGLELTPAQVEQMASEHEDVETMVGAIEEMARPRVQFKK